MIKFIFYLFFIFDKIRQKSTKIVDIIGENKIFSCIFYIGGCKMVKKMLIYISNLVGKCYNYIRVGSDIMNNGVDILDVAKILICKFNNEDKPITQLKLQKLLYFIEAYYMVNYDEERLYKEEFNAWTYGPLCQKVYLKYKYFTNNPIYEDSCDNLPNLKEKIMNSIDKVCSTFGELNVSDLVALTHMENSPWDKTPKNCNATISKVETKKWFMEKFITDESK